MSAQFKPQTAAVIARNKARRVDAHMKACAKKQAKLARKKEQPADAVAKKVKKIIIEGVRIPTAMRSAFDGILMRNINLSSKGAKALAGNILEALQTNMGTRAIGKGWNAHLSFKTAKALVMPACEHQYARMPYDSMVNG